MRVLLHACCAICSAYPAKKLAEEGFEVTIYFCNPNIFPQSEWQKRLKAELLLCPETIAEPYDPKAFYEAVKGFETEEEGGARCAKCFRLRLEKTAKKAKELGFDAFTTSISISPHKNFKTLSEIGEEVSEKYGVKFLAVDFKKQDGFLKTNKIANELGLYRQNYCGCEFSLKGAKNGMQTTRKS